MDFRLLRAIALLCNITVVSGGTFIFYRQGFLKLKKVLPLVLLSVPMAYLGGRLPIQQNVFFVLLGMALFLAALLMFFQKSLQEQSQKRWEHWSINTFIGGIIGFVSGMLGIGGGIFLAPVLHLIRWDSPKVIAATASLFIFVNSIAGLLGQMSGATFEMDWGLAAVLMASVLLGGQLGSRVSALQLQQQSVKKITAVLILVVAVRILYKYLPLLMG